MRLTKSIVSLFLLSVPFLGLVAAAGEKVEVEILHEVECKRRSTKGDKIEVHYRGTLASDGSEFDASYNRGSPLSFTVGKGQVIKGWDDGLLDLCVGDKRKLTIPPALGYGARAMGPIPADSTLIFEVELMGIAGVGKDEL
ncbi:MAG: Peptidyl-prolyl cis-trans isomerase fpr2 [Lichina confinis]|nr:MAG: Peptidyl-prolyl cis-trans isomerase fpr2 [Lichina confinis]